MTRHTETVTVLLGWDEKRGTWHRFADLLAEFAAVDFDEDPLTDECTFRMVAEPTLTRAGLVVVVEIAHDEGDPRQVEWDWPAWATRVDGRGQVAA